MQRFPNQYNKTHIICILFLVDVTTQNDKEDGHNSLKWEVNFFKWNLKGQNMYDWKDFIKSYNMVGL
jgi:hypothetical protein